MDKNTPLSSPSSEHEMEPKGNDITKKKEEAYPNEPSIQAIKNIQNYSKALSVRPSKSVLEFIEYVCN